MRIKKKLGNGKTVVVNRDTSLLSSTLAKHYLTQAVNQKPDNDLDQKIKMMTVMADQEIMSGVPELELGDMMTDRNVEVFDAYMKSLGVRVKFLDGQVHVPSHTDDIQRGFNNASN